MKIERARLFNLALFIRNYRRKQKILIINFPLSTFYNNLYDIVIIMMQQIRTYRTMILGMVFLLLTTSTGFSLDIHYCQGKIKSIGLFGEASSCHETTEESSCNKKTEGCCKAKKTSTKDTRKDCCKNKTVNIQFDADFTDAQTTPVIEPQNLQYTTPLNVFYAYRYNLDFLGSIVRYSNYKPPLLDRDIPILVQSFLL